jgi:glutaredoxin-related protein
MYFQIQKLDLICQPMAIGQLFPQLWVAGELVGGCDIVTEMHEKGELKTLIDENIGDQAQS